MGILRNSIYINGLTSEDKLPKKINGQMIEYSEVDYIYIPKNKAKVVNIKEVDLKLEFKLGRIVNTATGTLFILDGVKKINIEYITNRNNENKINMDFKLPFNTFIDVPSGSDSITYIDAHIVDSYFSVINSRKIYCHMLFMIDVNYSSSNSDISDHKITPT